MRFGFLFLIFLVAGCTGKPSVDVNTSPDVVIQGFSFVPETLDVSVGDSVVWLNNNSAVHTIVADDGSFSSGVLNNGGFYSFTFTVPGIYEYHCSVHPSMRGVIIVD
ncbi:MAG TPA: plastocyanin/azurin family copper-binding protein [Candidatus Nanoarchaeia archaeon]|nr:plastocyanin/azurin family copper-binding protein [Candidatus Nanoarchaeia archaeon]